MEEDIELIKEIINDWKDDINFTFIESPYNVILDRSPSVIYYSIELKESDVLIFITQYFPRMIRDFYSYSLFDDISNLKKQLERFYNVELFDFSNQYSGKDKLGFSYLFSLNI